VACKGFTGVDRGGSQIGNHSLIYNNWSSALLRPISFRSKVVIVVICRECSSSRLRLSRVRWKDVERLLLLQYPVRCQRCERRDYAGLRWALWRACKAR
jgi:hypothetical protein